ncbi:hypothetical protein LZP69_12290 [Shewanella sp. AS1]|uniref:hypothetical protein n=1 Tax=Shewanella sp. AS1 TaxID=2907626 RepID=UPI001F47BEF1|nr:hypothetical protein [Shewanella sp. AS1]MCE9679943.1 hypothetical protein [Shewanella sp. AS1]
MNRICGYRTGRIAQMLMVMLVTLQFAVANFSAHQLHLGNHEQENDNHPHLQLTTQIISFEPCLDCQCELETDPKAATHAHKIKKIQTQETDLCLDCHCHGGHLSLLSQMFATPVMALADRPASPSKLYFPPDTQPSYRPPIA